MTMLLRKRHRFARAYLKAALAALLLVVAAHPGLSVTPARDDGATVLQMQALIARVLEPASTANEVPDILTLQHLLAEGFSQGAPENAVFQHVPPAVATLPGRLFFEVQKSTQTTASPAALGAQQQAVRQQPLPALHRVSHCNGRERYLHVRIAHAPPQPGHVFRVQLCG